jgi:hypothetical protein
LRSFYGFLSMSARGAPAFLLALTLATAAQPVIAADPEIDGRVIDAHFIATKRSCRRPPSDLFALKNCARSAQTAALPKARVDRERATANAD